MCAFMNTLYLVRLRHSRTHGGAVVVVVVGVAGACGLQVLCVLCTSKFELNFREI